MTDEMAENEDQRSVEAKLEAKSKIDEPVIYSTI